MRRPLAPLVVLCALGFAAGGEQPASAKPEGRLQDARDRVEAFYRSLPATDPQHRTPAGVEGPLCGTLRGHAPWVERTLLSDLEDPGRSEWLKAKALTGLSCVWSAGESRCLGSLAEKLVALDGEPAGLSPALRYAVTGWLERLTRGMSVPRADAGRYRRKDYERWWLDQGRWLIRGTCGDART